MIPKHFSFVSFHTLTMKIVFDSKDPFLMMMEAKRKKKEKTERFFRIHRHNWMPPESVERKSAI